MYREHLKLLCDTSTALEFAKEYICETGTLLCGTLFLDTGVVLF